MANLLKLTGKELCELLTVSRMTLNRWCKEALPRNSDGSYPGPAVFQWLTARIEEKLAARSISPEDSAWLEQVRKFNALRSKLAYEIEMGKYTLTDEAQQHQLRLINSIVEVFDRMPDRCAGLLAGKDRQEVHLLLRTELHVAKEILAAGLRYDDAEAGKVIFAMGGMSPWQAMQSRIQAERGKPNYLKFDPYRREFTDERDGTVVPEAEAGEYVRRYPYKDGKDDERAALRESIAAGSQGGEHGDGQTS